MNHPQLNKANSAIVAKIKLQVISAYLDDTGSTIEGCHTIKEYNDYFKAKNPKLYSEIFKALAILENTFNRITLSQNTVEELSHYPHLANVLNRYSFYTCSKPNAGKDIRAIANSQFYLICEQGFSFGGNRLVYMFLTYNILIDRTARLKIYNLPEELNTFHELPHLIASEFSSISCHDIDKHRFTCEEITALHPDIGITHINKKCLPALKKQLAIESSKEASNYTSAVYPEDSDLTILEKFSRIVNQKLSLPNYQLIRRYLPYQEEFGKRPIALICNRDSAYVGPSQPWRDSEIEHYDKSIEYLISEGYFVIRYNSCGKPINILNKFFLDLSQLKSCDQKLQLHLAASCKLIIGANTGVTGFAQTVSSAPTLYIDAPTLHAHSPWLKLIGSPKRLEIMNKKLVDPGAINALIKSAMWDYKACEDLGIKIRPHNSDSILKEVIYFLDVVKKNKWHSVTTFREINHGVPCEFNTMLTPNAASNLSEILSQV
ncbi:TIGR04372 family glycosyltransferase [Synechococcus sp. UW179B]|uniref:TIGR04372 family glycosyltransferase n=1 Tax=Synechococcus sp. UW179B TaxID=2575516 RepID=UPI000E0E6DA3|nr:TIGR04372 family glycosyltransferase [Synechococcus sp. UW179B]